VERYAGWRRRGMSARADFREGTLTNPGLSDFISNASNVISRGLNTVSTDDAYVNSHVTFVAARVSGQVMQVLVDDNSRVRTGDVLVELDREPFRVQVAIKQSAVDVANANLIMAEANVRGLVAQVRSQRFKLTHAIEDVDNQVALIRQRGDMGSKQGEPCAGAARSLTVPSVYSRARS
jgi:multidrug resistance efflux pump